MNSSSSPSSPGHIVGVIPARLASTRLPRKVLRPLAGQPLLAWVVQAALRCPQLDEVIVAADSPEVLDLCRQHGWRAQLTSPELPSGTDRLFAVARTLPADIYVNIQADEPLLTPAHITALLGPFTHPHADVTTLRVPCPPESLADPNVVKVVIAADGRALYFSRASIPFHRDAARNVAAEPAHADAHCFKHLGLYAYRAAALARFAALPPGRLEQIERLEQLRLLENNLALYVADAPTDTIGVDTEADLHRVEALLQSRSANSP
jgi:3-deoxy-manno-octulosonate cytidylyltransferase (CMP-KDO synthetase)